jgi:Ca2+ transporting ATPase
MDGDRKMIFVKGASEIVLEGCSQMQGFDGQLLEMTKDLKNQIQTAIENMANQALRTIIIA